MRVGALLCWVLIGLSIWAESPAHAPAHGKAPPKAENKTPRRMSDADIAEYASQAIKGELTDPPAESLAIIRKHHFLKATPEQREVVLYAQGLLEYRLGQKSQAMSTLRKAERAFPSSKHLNAIQVPLAEEAIEKKDFKDAEERLRKALNRDLALPERRKVQELLIWTLVEQDRAAEGEEVLSNLLPLPTGERASERRLAGLFLVQCALKNQERAESARKSFKSAYPNSALHPRLELAFAVLLGEKQENLPAAAKVLKGLIEGHPKSPQANEARLILATILTEGSFPKKEKKSLPNPETLIQEASGGLDATRRKLLVELRLASSREDWWKAVKLGDRWRNQFSKQEGDGEAQGLWRDAWTHWAMNKLNKQEFTPVLASLTPEKMDLLSPEARERLIQGLAKQGFGDGAMKVIAQCPESLQERLRQQALSLGNPRTQPESVLAMLSTRSSSPEEQLLRAIALAQLERWSDLAHILPLAKPGAERMETQMRYLRRPGNRSSKERLQEAEGALRRAKEPTSQLEGLKILLADLKVETGDYQGALAHYPTDPSSSNRAWVALMKATCFHRLGRISEARACLEGVKMEKDFSLQRDLLLKKLPPGP